MSNKKSKLKRIHILRCKHCNKIFRTERKRQFCEPDCRYEHHKATKSKDQNKKSYMRAFGESKPIKGEPFSMPEYRKIRQETLSEVLKIGHGKAWYDATNNLADTLKLISLDSTLFGYFTEAEFMNMLLKLKRLNTELRNILNFNEE